MKLTKKQIDLIRSKTPETMKGLQISITTTLGYYQPKNANWCYIAGWVITLDCLGNEEENLVVTRFGEIM